ncbi:uncharacterized protein LOC121733851 [Aricia agestis]|uniref:uncharacterized protein LOC121733851 n=1 Tax=Aricia agestis TaxID=91739 RepID=UPI001C206B22|nr:uncharacterized protein LOC121733851 [Aricia agestis]
MKLKTVVRKLLILLQLTSVMPKRRISTDLESGETVFYFKDSKEIDRMQPNSPNHKGARSDTEDLDEDDKVKQPPLPTPRRVYSQECKICVTVCCGSDCQCANQLLPSLLRASPGLQPTTKNPMALPIEETRRGFSNRDYIKSVLTNDGDISSVLNNLVKITLQKVDMMKKMDNMNVEGSENFA